MTDVDRRDSDPPPPPPSPEPPEAPPARRARTGREQARADAAKRWPLSRIVGAAVLALLLFSVAAVEIGRAHV